MILALAAVSHHNHTYANWDFSDKQVTNTLTEACQENGVINIFCDGVVSNKGRADRKQVGASSRVLYQGGKEHLHSERILGKSVTDSDTILRSIHAGLDVLTTFLDSDLAQQHNLTTISLTSGAAVKKALDSSPHEDQEESIRLLKRLGNILERFPHANVAFLWLPRKAPFIGFKRAKQLALEAIRMACLEDIIEPHTIANQKKLAREAAIVAWTEIYYLSLHASLIYRTALTQPPYGKTHHTLLPKHAPNAGPGGTPNDAGEQEAKFSHLTFTTFYHIITGHAFTGAYTQHFFPPHTPEQITCPCGEPIQTVEHILLHCPQYTTARQELLTANGHPQSFPQLIENQERVILLLRFIEETGACIKLWATWEPG